MNAIETFAIQLQMDVTDYNSTLAYLNLILEKLEVKAGDKWLPVKVEGTNTYLPKGIEEDLLGISQLAKFFQEEFLSPVFQKSDASKATNNQMTSEDTL